MKVIAANSDDMPAWLDLAREVEHLFGPMADEESFQNALLDAIHKGNAFCLRDRSRKGVLCGGVVININNHEVVWLAVSEKSRRQGAGSLLLSHAMERLGISNPISVVTFADSIPEGLAARQMYIRRGFIDREHMGKNPAGFPIVLMVKCNNAPDYPE